MSIVNECRVIVDKYESMYIYFVQSCKNVYYRMKNKNYNKSITTSISIYYCDKMENVAMCLYNVDVIASQQCAVVRDLVCSKG